MITARFLSTSSSANNSWFLSFSGAGHLLSYHLGAARTLLLENPKKSARIQSVAGSSSGAIMAAILACFPHRIEEYTSRFIEDGGRAFGNFREMLVESSINKQTDTFATRPLLHIATTNCTNGSLKLFSFDPNNPQGDHYHMLLLALQASCLIPPTFHPWDSFSRYSLSYPPQHGIEIDGQWYVDGAIAAPAPLVNDNKIEFSSTIVISPVSGSSLANWSIRPMDTSWKVPLIGNITARCGTFTIRPSVQNLKAVVVSAGVASPQVLKDWYQRGVDDAHHFLKEWNEQNTADQGL